MINHTVRYIIPLVFIPLIFLYMNCKSVQKNKIGDRETEKHEKTNDKYDFYYGKYKNTENGKKKQKDLKHSKNKKNRKLTKENTNKNNEKIKSTTGKEHKRYVSKSNTTSKKNINRKNINTKERKFTSKNGKNKNIINDSKNSKTDMMSRRNPDKGIVSNGKIDSSKGIYAILPEYRRNVKKTEKTFSKEEKGVKSKGEARIFKTDND